MKIEIGLTEEVITGSARAGDGAHVAFHGIVRPTEAGRPILGIRYTAYRPMVERTFAEIGARALERFGDHDGSILHRIGLVEAGAAAIRIEVSTPHSPLAFELCPWYLQQIKSEVPIWKEPVFEDSPTPS